MERVRLKFKEAMSFEASVEGIDGTILLDAHKKYGGSEQGFRAKPLLLVALGGCTAMDVASLLRKMRVQEIESFEVEVEAKLSRELPIVYTVFRVVYCFVGESDELSVESLKKLHRIVEMSQHRYCGMSAMLRHVAPICYCITYNGKPLDRCVCEPLER